MQEPTLVNPSKLFDPGNRYVAPVFQRYYVWDAKSLDALMADIDRALEDPESKERSFLGAIVLQDRGRTAGPTSPQEYLIIDGQQRLTTVYMLLATLARIDIEYADGNHAEIIASRFLALGASGPHRGRPKLIPTLQDRHALWSYLKEHLGVMNWDFDQDRGDRSRGKKIKPQLDRMYDEMIDRFIDHEDNYDSEAYEDFLAVLLERLEFVNITLDVNDDANEIFRKLNFEGTPLAISDLIRNDVFSKFLDPQEAKEFYNDKWVKFEERFPGESLSEYFYPFSVIKFEGDVTKGTAFSKLRDSWKNSKPHGVMKELEKYQSYYCALTSGEPVDALSDEVNWWVDCISRMRRSRTIWPFVIRVLHASGEGQLNDDIAIANIRIVESFMARRALAGWEPTGLHAVFKSLWKKTEGDPQLVIENIVSSTIQYPEDDDLIEQMVKNRIDHRSIIPYFFQEYELDCREESGADPLPYEALESQTIEHVLPQKYNDNWSHVFSAEQHERLVGMLGNLTPLSEKQNKTILAKGWDKKLVRFEGSNWMITQSLAATTKWSPQVIKSRTRELAEWAVERWPSLDELV